MLLHGLDDEKLPRYEIHDAKSLTQLRKVREEEIGRIDAASSPVRIIVKRRMCVR